MKRAPVPGVVILVLLFALDHAARAWDRLRGVRPSRGLGL